MRAESLCEAEIRLRRELDDNLLVTYNEQPVAEASSTIAISIHIKVSQYLFLVYAYFGCLRMRAECLRHVRGLRQEQR